MALRKIETPEGTRYGKQDAWIGTNEAAIRVDGDRIKSVNFTYNKGKGEGKDDIPAGGITDNDVAVLSAPYTEGIEDSLMRLQQYKDTPDNISSRLGTGNIAMSTKNINDANRKHDEDVVKSRMAMQAADHEYIDGLMHAKCGKNLPGFKWGTSAWPNAISSGLAGIGGITQYLDAAGQTINSPNIYAANPYERQALSTLAGLRDNPYQQLRAMQDAERRNRYAIAQSGGLTGAQKYYANVAGGIGMQKNYADILNRSNAQNNQYKANWASSALQAGQATAARQMQANQYRDEAYAKAHAARQQQKQMGMFNMINAVQQFYANEFKRNQFNKMYDLYAADVDLKRKEFEANHPETNKINVAPIPAAPISPKIGITAPEYLPNDVFKNNITDWVNPKKWKADKNKWRWNSMYQ